VGFKQGFEKVAFLPLVGALGRLAAGGLGRLALGAGKAGIRAGSKAVGLATRLGGGPLNTAFTVADVAGQTSDNLKHLKEVYR
jgi:hypothetical protein